MKRIGWRHGAARGVWFSRALVAPLALLAPLALVALVAALTFSDLARADQADKPADGQVEWPTEWVEQAMVSSPIGIAQGQLVRLRLREGVTVALNGQPLPVVNGWTAFGFDRDHETSIELDFARKQAHQKISLPIAKRNYEVQRIDGLPPQYVTPPPEELARIKSDGLKKKQARAASDLRADFAQPFIWPVRGRITGVFGSQRFYNGEPRRPHYGVDIAAPAGTDVVATASGRVSLAEPDMYFEGGLIFIDHGLGVTSIYMHLGEVLVSAGQDVVAGEVIGRVGSTGRSTGAHLDWRVQWQGANLDPLLLVADEAPAKP